jgi:hypothetical protein
MRGAALNVRTPKRGSTVPVFGPLVSSAQVTRRWPEKFCTELVVTARVGRKQVEMTVEDKALRRRYGRVTAKATYGEQRSRSGIRARAKREIKSRSMMEKTVAFSHPGMIDLRRGQQIVLELPGYAFGFPMFVASLSHSVSAGEHDMQVECTFDDPIPDAAGRKIKEQNSREKKKSQPSTSAKAKQRRGKVA